MRTRKRVTKTETIESKETKILQAYQKEPDIFDVLSVLFLNRYFGWFNMRDHSSKLTISLGGKAWMGAAKDFVALRYAPQLQGRSPYPRGTSSFWPWVWQNPAAKMLGESQFSQKSYESEYPSKWSRNRVPGLPETNNGKMFSISISR